MLTSLATSLQWGTVFLPVDNMSNNRTAFAQLNLSSIGIIVFSTTLIYSVSSHPISVQTVVIVLMVAGLILWAKHGREKYEKELEEDYEKWKKKRETTHR